MGDLRPRIITKQNVLSSLIAPAGARNAAMLFTATWGPIGEIKTITSVSDFIATFGNDKTGSTITGIKGADLFFANGGTLKAVRVEDGDADESSLVLQNSTTDVITLTAAYKGTEGDKISVTVTDIDGNRGVDIQFGSIIESYNNLGDGYPTNEVIVDAINETSTLVTAVVETGEETSNLLDEITATYLTGGDDGDVTVALADYTDVMDSILLNEDYNFLLIPGIVDDSSHAIVVGKLNTRASTEKKYSRFITGVDTDETITTIKARTTSGMRCSVLAPSVVYTHRVDGETNLDGSYLACAYAGMLCNTALEVSGTHNTVNVEGVIVNITTGKEFYSKPEQSELIGANVIPVSLIGSSVQAVRAVTRISDTTDVRFEEVIVDILDYVTAQAENYLNGVIGKPNTAETRTVYAARLDAILQSIKDEGIIEDFNDSLVSEGASPDTINATLSVKPTYNANFVNLTINIQ